MKMENKETQRKSVFEEVMELTGLPKDFIEQEVPNILGLSQDSANTLTLEQFRHALLNYIESMIEPDSIKH